MKKNIVKLLSLVALLFLSSCNGLYHYNKVNTTSLSPDHVRLNMDMENIELLGQTTISLTSRTYFGIFKTIDSVNNVKYDFREVKKVDLAGRNSISLPRDLQKAAYKVIEEYPNADFYVPVYTQKQVRRLFFGKQQTRTAVVKAFKLK
ncbi:MAG: hypothetical protein LBL13_03505 [Bacteroidales bacterium]|nr:hypothetical protein [Bacteroidales bacterium]